MVWGDFPQGFRYPHAVAWRGWSRKEKVMVKRRGRKTVAEAIREIRWFYEQGRKSLEKFPDRLPFGEAERSAKRLGLTGEMLRNARRFARRFSKSELNRICERISAGGYSVTFQHLNRLVWLKRDDEFWNMLERTIKNGLSCRELLQAIQRQTGKRSRAGRRPRVKDRAGAIQKLLSWSEEWGRLRRVIYGARDGEKNGNESLAKLLPPSLDVPVRECDQAVEKLYRAAGRFRKDQ